MLSYFRLKGRQKLLLLELKKWEGTPFVGHMAVPGLGADCVRFAHRVYFDIGAVFPITWPQYPLNIGGPPVLEQLLSTMNKAAKLVKVRRNSIKTGDFLVFFSRALCHGAVAVTPVEFYHCIPKYGVQKNTIEDETYNSRFHSAWRIMEE